jgi:RNA polymerase sigma-70 factor (ECF subfamily)
MSWRSEKSSEGNDGIFAFTDSLSGYAMVLTCSHGEAEDLVQKTCFYSIRAKKSFEGSTNRKAWLFAVLRNARLDQSKKRCRTPEPSLVADALPDFSTEEDPTNAEGGSERDDEQECVRRAIQQLPRNFREIIFLREYEELSYKEIAGLLNCTHEAVTLQLGRARSQLRMILAVEIRAMSVTTSHFE